MSDTRSRLLGILLAPHGVTADEVLADGEIEKGCMVVDGRGLRVVTRAPLVRNTSQAMADDDEDALRRMADNWMPFLSRSMRTASLRKQGLGAMMSPSWSILVNPITLAVAETTGIPARRLTTSRLHEGKREFVPLHDGDFEDMPSTDYYVRDGIHHDGADYLHGQFLLNHADHVVRHALQLLEDTRFPIRSVSDAEGRETHIQLRILLPETTCTALTGRPLSDLLDIPGFGPGTDAGRQTIVSVEPKDVNGRTIVRSTRCFVPATPPPADADMRWASMTPAW